MKILMLCLGNICRSPLAGGILRNKISEEYFVDSAGTSAYHEGAKADPRSIQTADFHGIDINGHRSRPLVKDDFEIFDRIYCMDKQNYKDAMALAENEEQRQKLELILEDENEVPDPYYGGVGGFEKVYHMLDKACDRIILELNLKPRL
ncbi:low molecular weight protein-tyrosine-phosphatase [Riemerella anatipestifer]|uniref:protein-tyrosine-phosphatase n=1 Tax=Riemerella anatipestifer RA-CH-1 TaxID=1228997 RepID=J9R166_RIEAN|nr:low molecular weight protein-tyrosine-phosphatase [Riemerella anatipestifer]AFR36695.1 Protein-tyrosine-phosphatase [Riemerella anatipestifer RA-CH-1]AZZ57615.1 low molecular weight phosphotyrosine protein phosphatase [Riemerella anatipestifer]MCO7318951.1 low molecular weight phosphotyrosine protein phosphatase [Riemerella anatipestifer]MCO7331274.1 low molecular weight phosphotyrosine protein phosphatase [Riemerella anatipestifer]MCO7350255.1 low molecular weight phosphotyrosine protein p